jgi:hypothetical protein
MDNDRLFAESLDAESLDESLEKPEKPGHPSFTIFSLHV